MPPGHERAQTLNSDNLVHGNCVGLLVSKSFLLAHRGVWITVPGLPGVSGSLWEQGPFPYLSLGILVYNLTLSKEQ